MENQKQETDLKLSKSQLESVIKAQLLQENGLNDVFAMFVNGLMYSERQAFLHGAEGNKGNGYRQATRAGIGSKLQLKIPRDRLGVFQPVILGLLNEQEEQIKDLCFELYGKGLTTRQIESVVENIYGTTYSKSSISRITTDFSALVDAWLERHLDAFYPIIYIDATYLVVASRYDHNYQSVRSFFEIFRPFPIFSISFCQREKGLEVYAYCIMTSHIHMIIGRNGGLSLSDIVRDLKSFTSRHTRKAIESNCEESKKEWMMRRAVLKNNRNKDFQFWFQPTLAYRLLGFRVM